MSENTAINIVLMQKMSSSSVANPHFLAFLDVALFYKYQFESLGKIVTLTKNRLKYDAVNIIFGANDMVPTGWENYCCLFVNLEQLAKGGCHIDDEYKELQKNVQFIDYSKVNIREYSGNVNDVIYAPLGYAPYLRKEFIPIEKREIDVLFIGSMNEKRKRVLELIESNGVSVSFFSSPLYGPERDYFIQNSKCVFNCHYYDSAIFEEVRAFNSLSIGTPFVSLLDDNEVIPPNYNDSVFFIKENELVDFFKSKIKSKEFYSESYAKLDCFKLKDPSDYYKEIIKISDDLISQKKPSNFSEEINKIHIGSGKDYRAGWINIDISEEALPDIILDLSSEHSWPVKLKSPFLGDVTIKQESYDFIYANNVLEHVPNLVRMMSNCLDLLKVGGRFFIEVPYEKSVTAWQDPTHVRAMNANSWVYYTEWFWYLGWFEYKFIMKESCFLDINLSECQESNAAFMRVLLEKAPSTFHEKCVARAMQANMGGIGDSFVY
ncbi:MULTISPECIES: class I SAM-dependent methyltransferase [unclassified Brenneria]|uniref:class I SAM-dependent methyltransferase n=1 Tax=unclassified Brenneria TaxID=2634434 RepID=UPI0029C55EFA|nr:MULTISPECIES: class I SAM-dependent methyltransferase [unclassified Brenneria]MDX5630730.1 class I SAM-dependent methyltransferase [Brenneria sp. L3-3Z]MDX5694218.1 class I SAM-dependent methyltransferase [Brenneria sp. L4-2C]